VYGSVGTHGWYMYDMVIKLGRMMTKQSCDNTSHMIPMLNWEEYFYNNPTNLKSTV
jgi:hypothetical protein